MRMRRIAAREDVADLILDAADRLLASRGYRGLTMEELAEQVGIGKGTIYLHFRSKEELVLAHIDRIVQRLTGRLWGIAHREAPAPERLRQMVLARVLFRFDSVAHYAASLSDLLAAIRPALLARRQRHFEDEARVFAEVLRDGQRAGAFAERDVHATAHTLLAATNALLPYSLSIAELGRRRDIERSAGRIADLLLEGLLARPS
jgi:AcrR family transcriptional regulator